MQKFKVLTICLVISVITGCGINYKYLKHRETPYFTKSTYRLSKTVSLLIRKKFQNNGNNVAPYIVGGVMPADEFIDTSSRYRGKLVSYSARVETEDTDIIRLIWSYDPKQYEGAPPEPLLFPYPHEISYTNRHYLMKFIPVEDFKQMRLEHVWDNTDNVPGIKFKDVLYLSRTYSPAKGDFTSQVYPQLFYNEFSSLGEIFEFVMIDGKRVKCYLITSDMYDGNSPHYVRWKIKI